MSKYYERTINLGATYLGKGRCRFRVWAPYADKVDLHVLSPKDKLFPMEKLRRGYYQLEIDPIEIGTRYLYRLNDDVEHPDPVSRYQSSGVTGPSRVVDSNFSWNDDRWFGRSLKDYVIYELHVGTYTSEGNFGAILPHLSDLRDLGITALELMPVTQFPGNRNWGYDVIFPFAVQHTYGGPVGLKRLIDACHMQDLAVILDLVYGRMGREGNCLGAYGPYLDQNRMTKWGPAINFDGPDSDEVRRYFIQNAIYWFTEYHVDAIRLHALDSIIDISAKPFLEELVQSTGNLSEQLNRRVYIFAGSDQNDARLIRPQELGGHGLDAIWNNDFHHSLHALITGEQYGYYKDYGDLRHLAKAYTEGFVYTGQRSAYRRRRHGSFSGILPAKKFIVSSQNHSEVGSRLKGERLAALVTFDSLKLAAGTVILSPYIPLLFMGEEYGETTPFRYFADYSEAELIEQKRRDLAKWNDDFGWEGEPLDPLDESVFLGSKLVHNLEREGEHKLLSKFYKELIRLRRQIPALFIPGKLNLEVNGWERAKVMYVRRWCEGSEAFYVCNFSDEETTEVMPVPVGTWQKRLDSAEEKWQGEGSRVPETLHSVGEAAIPLSRRSIVLFEAEGRE